ncbi:MAG: lysophospholipid acyltransferase family protein [Myxococcota bacterium]|nr:lysophospholipid acyltransferase family protein [Myxococcota bacterium]
MSDESRFEQQHGHPISYGIRLTSFVVSLVVRFILLTVRVHRIGPPFDRNGVIAFWHGEQLPLLAVRPSMESVAPVSLSRDGTLQANILRRFGVTSVRGSSSRGGLSVLRNLLRELKTGRSLLVAVDGPRGPRHKAKPGAQYLARKAGVPLWCISAFAPRALRLRKSWDRFLIPLPFSKIYVCVSEPHDFNGAGPQELAVADIERSLHRLKETAKAYASANSSSSFSPKNDT